MTPSELKLNVENTGSVYFTRKSMAFFGDTMANYKVIDGGFCWILQRKKAVKHGLKSNAFFDKVTFKKLSTQEINHV